MYLLRLQLTHLQSVPDDSFCVISPNFHQSEALQGGKSREGKI